MTSLENKPATLADVRRSGERRLFLATALMSLASPEPLLAAPAPAPLPQQPEAGRPRIVFFSPNSEGNTYWPQVFRIISHVSDDLGFDFVPYSFGVQDRFTRQSDALRILSAEPRPQAVIVSVVIGHSKGIVEAAKALNVPVFIMGPLFPSELPGVGGAPRMRYKNWVALFNWAEEEKGYALGKALLAEAQRAGTYARDGTIHVVGLGGDQSWFGSGLRQAGLARALAAYPKAVLKQVVPTRWTLGEGKQLTAKLLARFPETSVIWAASDQLGAGAVQAVMEAGKIPGQAVFTGGLDLSDFGLAIVKEGWFVATAAGTMLSYAQVAVLVYDYLHGLDFAEQFGADITFPTYVATKANADQHLRLSRCVGSIDFKKVSKVHNKGLRRYDFSLDAYREASKSCVGG